MFSRPAALLLVSAVLLFNCSPLAWSKQSRKMGATTGKGGASDRQYHRTPALQQFTSDSVGPYSILTALATAGIHQATNNPPEWHEGFSAFSQRFGSNLGITATGNAVRYSLATAMNVDLKFEKCHCRNVFSRLGHAFKETALTRHPHSTSPILSVPNLVAPYIATTVAVYAWYPARYGIKDAFRMGNYNLLGTLGTNIAFEFIPSVALRFLHHIHLSVSRMTAGIQGQTIDCNAQRSMQWESPPSSKPYPVERP